MKKYRRHNQYEMFAHVKACRNINQPQKIYCKQQGLAYSTFHYWAKKYRQEFSENEAHSNNDAPGFIPVKVQPDVNTEQARIVNKLHFLFPNGIQVMCPESVRPEVLRTLLNP